VKSILHHLAFFLASKAFSSKAFFLSNSAKASLC
jgi:hypothetical protein